MPEPWTGEVVGIMHNAGITYDELGAKLGVGKAYISMILNSKRAPKDIEQRVKAAVDELLSDQQEQGGLTQ